MPFLRITIREIKILLLPKKRYPTLVVNQRPRIKGPEEKTVRVDNHEGFRVAGLADGKLDELLKDPSADRQCAPVITPVRRPWNAIHRDVNDIFLQDNLSARAFESGEECIVIVCHKNIVHDFRGNVLIDGVAKDAAAVEVNMVGGGYNSKFHTVYRRMYKVESHGSRDVPDERP